MHLMIGQLVSYFSKKYGEAPETVSVATNSKTEYTLTGDYDSASTSNQSDKSVTVDASSSIGQVVKEHIDAVEEEICLKGAYIDGISFSQPGLSAHFPDSWSFYTAKDSEGWFLVTVRSDSVDPSIKELLNESLETVIQKENDPEFSEDQIRDIQFLFSSMKENMLESVNGQFRTPNPHKYYTADSLESYLDHISDSQEEYEKLLEKDAYPVTLRLNDRDEQPPYSVTTAAELCMRSHIQKTLQTDVEHMPQSSLIGWGEPSNEQCEEIIQYFIRIPFTDNTLGKTY
jgi:hypothetical protein